MKAFLGILDLHSGVLLTFNFGHVNPIIKSKNGNTSFISGPVNPLLGESYDLEFTPLPLPLNAGDLFYFYSNDMIELQNAGGEKYGRERLWNVIYTSGNNAAETIQSVRQAVMDFGGETSREADIAIAVLEYIQESADK